MSIYDRDYYREKQKGESKSSKIFKVVWYLILFLFAVAFGVYLMAVFSK